jgi:hypothetical protein
MALDTYAGLKTVIASYVDRDLADNVDDFIDLAEVKHRADIRLREQLVRHPFIVVNRYASLPVGYLGGKTIRLMTDPVTPLQHVEQEKMDRVRRETEGRPLSYTIHEQIEFDRPPDENYSAEIIYYKEVTPLSDSNTTNVILGKSPDAYLYGALACTASWLMHDERVPMWESMYQEAIARLHKADQRKVSTLRMRPPQR